MKEEKEKEDVKSNSGSSEEESSEKEEEKEEEKPKENHFIPDKENPYNNMNMENPEIDELEEDDYTIICWNCKKPIVIEE